MPKFYLVSWVERLQLDGYEFVQTVPGVLFTTLEGAEKYAAANSGEFEIVDVELLGG